MAAFFNQFDHASARRPSFLLDERIAARITDEERRKAERWRAEATRERLRYTRYQKSGVLGQRIMQRLGDVGRALFPWMARSGWR